MDEARLTTTMFALAAASAMLTAAMPADADMATPMTLQIYVTRDDKPFEKAIDLTVVCRGSNIDQAHPPTRR